MSSFLTRRDSWGHGVPVWVIAIVVLLLPPIFWSLSHIDMHNDVAGWLPQDDPQARILAWYQENFPAADRVLVSWDDACITDPRLQQMAAILEGRPLPDGSREGGSPYVTSVSLPLMPLKRMLARDIPIETAIERVSGLLCGLGPLRIRLTEAGRLRGSATTTEILELATTTLGREAQIVPGDLPPPSRTLPTGEDIPLEDLQTWELVDQLEAWIHQQPEFDLALVWPGMHANPSELRDLRKMFRAMQVPASAEKPAGQSCIDETFFIPGSLAALSVTLSEAGVADRPEMMAAIRNAAGQVGIDSDALHLGGRPVVGAELNRAVEHSGWNEKYPVWDFPHRSPALFSAVICVVMALFMLRSLRLAVLVQVVAFVTVIAAVSLVPVTGGSMNMVLVVMPTLLAVLTTSAAIHLSNYWKHAESRDPATSVIQAAATAWLPCALASGTTAIGLASLMASNLVPVRDFGVYSAIGCIISFLAVLYLLPSLMLYWRRVPPRADQLDTHHWNTLGRYLARGRWPVIMLCVVATVVCGWGLYRFRTETKVIRYFPEVSRLYQDYVYLEDNLSGIVSVDTIVRFDTESQRESQQDGGKPNENGLTFLERARKVMALQQDIRKHPEISGTLSLASFLDLREKTPPGLTFFQRRQWAASRRQIGEKIRKELTSSGEESGNIASFLSLPNKANDFRTADGARLNGAGDELWRISAQAAILSDVDLEDLTHELNEIARRHTESLPGAGSGHVVTGLIPVFLRTQQAVLESLIRSFGMAFVLIAIVMMVLLRSLWAGLVTMLPNLMPVIVVFGILSWAELRVDIGTMITASVALGIAVDGTLHLLTWFQNLLREGKSIPDAVAGALQRCGPAMWQTSVCIGLGMLALVPAELLLISRFGWMLAALIFAALFADIVFLPALLAGPLGRLIQRSVMRRFALPDNESVETADFMDEDSTWSVTTPVDPATVRMRQYIEETR